ncbi:energy transducer TonB [Hydrogenimonas cancrithermarum]|uniref:TonB C-terminal domain-containing protein n=1 Tax=Hydrogenimonas cancrithermarum TaxID=2993563 RepID=A0ABM8FNK8_9BACT|nr:energy transducer TonB [Hydrogenimonas cancrithermarum]BDY13962.1 hypothetical protein HCR_22740 [Hydrogenimonas cancrithermarum]
MNRRKLLSLLLSLLIHIVILTTLWLLVHRSEKELTSSGAKRVQLALKDFVIPSPPISKKSPPAPKPVKPVTKQKPKKPKPAKPEPKPLSKPKKTKPAPKPKKTVSPTKRKHVKRAIDKPMSKPLPEKPVKPEKSENSSPLSELAGALGTPAMETPSQPQAPTIEQINNTFSDKAFYALYKDEFDHFTPDQKKFIKNNLSRIQGITQHYLTLRGYPPFAGQMGQQGTNVVEFYLLPNGDITDLKIIKPTGFEQLDQNSIDTIKTAYKDYPLPKEKTKIRFYIHYSIY